LPKTPSFWAGQMKIVNGLIKKYGLEFLFWCPKPNNYKITSMVWFLTEEGKHFLSDQLLEYSKQNTNLSIDPIKVDLKETKLGEDIILDKKPKTLKEFLNYGKER